jgi:hypothetical protein
MNKQTARMVWERNIARIVELHASGKLDDLASARLIVDAWREYVRLLARS